MNLDEALELVEKYITNKNLVKHMIAARACMKRVARHLGEDEETWALAGMLHDIDYQRTEADPSRHGLEAVEILREHGVHQDILNAIAAHVGTIERISKMDSALYCIDPLTGLIVASALMHPSRKLEGIDAEFVLRRFKEKRFAQGANRDQIGTCSELGLSLDEFVELCLEGMREVAAELGL
jgi:putative nucleotidyltransferase with HDIG domain